MGLHKCLWPGRKEQKGIFWEELGSLKGLWEGPWFIGSDCNMVLSPNERNRASRMSHPMRRFAEVLNELGLRGILLQGGPLHSEGRFFFLSVKSRIYIKNRAQSSQKVCKRSTKGENTTTLTYTPTRLETLPKNLSYQHYTT